ncbi:MAG TPA: alpha/beta hydrolase [Bacteroidia bacterium]|jgi:pimeloyl-ACP methyl ester carboxylesterase|nr:alpha/beta hydrolase [Bacteroidia bacterium]
MKPDLIILHGALGCKEQFIPWKEAFSENFNCHLLDFSGHGTKSAEEVDFSIELFSENLKNYIHGHNFIQPNILGYSMGGYVTLYTALQNKNLLGSIITLATKFDWNPESSKKEAGYLQPQIMLQKVPQLARQLKQRHGSDWEKVVEKTAKMMIQLGQKPRLTTDNIKEVKSKTKFCIGEKDKMVSVTETENMFKGSSNGFFSVLPDTDHLPETMNTKLIVSEVQDFLLNQAKK